MSCRDQTSDYNFISTPITIKISAFLRMTMLSIQHIIIVHKVSAIIRAKWMPTLKETLQRRWLTIAKNGQGGSCKYSHC